MLRQSAFLSIVLIILTACNNSDSVKNNSTEADTIPDSVYDDTLTPPGKLSFKNIMEVINDEKSYTWVNLNYKDSVSSLALHFNDDEYFKDRIYVFYTFECGFRFPYKVSSDSIIVYWDKDIDTKYDFDIVKAINSVDSKYQGQQFMILKLINDTTLEARYTFPELRDKLNAARNDRILFPDRYSVSSTYYM